MLDKTKKYDTLKKDLEFIRQNKIQVVSKGGFFELETMGESIHLPNELFRHIIVTLQKYFPHILDEAIFLFINDIEIAKEEAMQELLEYIENLNALPEAEIPLKKFDSIANIIKPINTKLKTEDF